LFFVLICNSLNFNTTIPSNSTTPSNSTSNSKDPIVVICPYDWFSNETCVLATDFDAPEIDYEDETQCTRAHSSLYLCMSQPTSSLTYRDEIEELLDEDY
ncbi:hypothetical protein PMAYCL1PPCAC_19338, partial [Pristionchus mayeri]